MGDRSPSMEVAIRTSVIIAGVLTAITSAKLVFFDDGNIEAPFLPKTIPEVLTLATTIDIGGGTAPAASLLPFYLRKEVVKTFILVTDEEENGEVKLEAGQTAADVTDTPEVVDMEPSDPRTDGYYR